MGTYAQLGPVKTWYDEAGEGEPLVLLHGGLVTNETWGPQLAELPTRFHVFAPERRGHGHTPDVEGSLHHTTMADDTIAFLESVVKRPAHLVGWSDGGIIGLLVAIKRPDLVKKLVAIGANSTTDGVPAPLVEGMLSMSADAPDLAMMRQLYEASSPDGPGHWPVVFGKFLEMMANEPNISQSELASISSPTLIVSGDDDLVTLEHTVWLYRSITGAELAVMPGTSHFLTMEKPGIVNKLIIDFLENDPVPQMMPITRAPVGAHP